MSAPLLKIFHSIKKTPLYRLLVGGEDDVK